MKKAILFLTLVLTCCMFTSAKKVNLIFNPSPGKTYQYVQETSQDITQTIFEQTISTKQNFRITFDMTVLAKNKNSIKLSYTYTDVLFEMKNNQMNMRYKYGEEVGDNAFNQILANTFNNLIGQSFEITHGADGSVTEVSGLEAILESFKTAYKDMEGSSQMIEQIQNSMLNEKSIKQMFEQSMKVYPGKPIQAGDSWAVEQTTEVPGILSLKTQSTYTLQSLEKKNAHVVVESVVTGDNMNGEQNGTIEYDLKSGLPINSTLNQKIDGEFKFNEFSIPMHISSTIKMTILE